MPLFFDPMYFLFIAPGILLAMWAQWRVKSAYAHASTIPARSGLSGAQTAAHLMQGSGISNVPVEPVEGYLTDHYSPSEKVLRLSPDVFQGRSLAALGIAAHEAGHAFQDAQRYPLLVIRNGLVPLASMGGSAAFFILLAGFLLQFTGLIYLGIAAFGLTVAFQLVNLPVEFDASARARRHLIDSGLITSEEEPEVARVLNAAALTYVAATLTGILTLLYYLYRAGLLGGSRDS